jgi:hypothetical protein
LLEKAVSPPVLLSGAAALNPSLTLRSRIFYPPVPAFLPLFPRYCLLSQKAPCGRVKGGFSAYRVGFAGELFSRRGFETVATRIQLNPRRGFLVDERNNRTVNSRITGFSNQSKTRFFSNFSGFS